MIRAKKNSRWPRDFQADSVGQDVLWVHPDLLGGSRKLKLRLAGGFVILVKTVIPIKVLRDLLCRWVCHEIVSPSFYVKRGVGNLPKIIPICSSEVMMAGCYRESSLASCDLHSALTLFNIRRQEIFVFCALHYSFFYVSPFTAVLSSGYCSFSTPVVVTSSS